MMLPIGLLGLLLITLVAAAKNGEMNDKIKEVYVGCAKELEMDEEKLKASFSQKRDRDRDCLDACTLRKVGVMDSGKLSEDVLVKLLEEELNEDDDKNSKLLKAASVCIDEAGTSDDECETAGAFSACFREKIQEIMKE